MISSSEHNSLREIYNPEGSKLRALQLRMLDVLREIDKICRKHKIKYWLSGGTLLGAVRHQGFIPWDDDLDIEVMRDDYQKLLDILAVELPSQFVVQDNKTDENYAYTYAKVRDTNSYIKEKYLLNQRFKYQGAFVDIFSIEASPLFLCTCAKKMYNRLCLSPARKDGFVYKSVFKCNRIVLLYIIFPLFRLFSFGADKNILHYSYGTNFLTPLYREELFPLKEINFEGYNFFAPQNPDIYLRTMYGNYMTIPEIKETHIKDNEIYIW